MPELEYEYCQLCGNATGRAGRQDDSIFCLVVKDYTLDFLEFHKGSEIGPLCVECYYELLDKEIIEEE